MKILYHHRTKAADGQYVHIAELTEALAALGHEIVMVGPGDSGPRRMDGGSGSSGGLRARLPGWLYEALELGYSAVAFWRLWKAWRQHRPDALYERYNLFCPAGVWLRRLTGLPLALEVNAPLFEERRDHGGLRLYRLAKWSERTVWRGADICLPVTGVLGEAIAGEGVRPDRVHVVPNGVGDAFLRPGVDAAETRRRLGLEGKLVLGFVGFVRPWHGMDRVVRLLASGRLPENAHLLMVGDGPALPDLRASAEALGIADRVTFTGVVQRPEMPSMIAAFDIALQPYAVPYASPLKLFEYLALSRPVVAPDQENIREILCDEVDALLFDPEDEDSFAQAIERLATDQILRDRLGAAGCRTLLDRDLSWRRNAERVTVLLAAAIEDRASAKRQPNPAPIRAAETTPARE